MKNNEGTPVDNGNKSSDNNHLKVHRSLEDVLGEEKLFPAGFKKTFKDIIYFVKKCDTVDLAQLIWRVLLVACVLVLILALPFQLFRDLGINMLSTFVSEINNTILSIWNGLWGVAYCVMSLILFYKIIKARFYKLANHEMKTSIKDSVVKGVNQTYNSAVNTIDNVKSALNTNSALEKELEENKPDYDNLNNEENNIDEKTENVDLNEDGKKAEENQLENNAISSDFQKMIEEKEKVEMPDLANSPIMPEQNDNNLGN